MESNSTRVRYSILELQEKYEKGDKKPLEDLMRAWKGIKDKEHSDPTSFFSLASIHGLPYRGEGTTDDGTWGGYCPHGNVLFPVWHRVYIKELEDQLREIPGCQDVTLPYWDQTDDYSTQKGLPWVFTNETFELDGKEIQNPLLSYVFQELVPDSRGGHEVNYTKPFGYETKRFPLAGQYGNDHVKERSEKHNAKYPDHKTNTELLNENVRAWISLETGKKYRKCLDAPNYTVFSNSTSANHYNQENVGFPIVQSLEGPHNDIHLTIGGFPRPGDYNEKNPQRIFGASGDMGETDTSSFDPIFWFHHCNIDRMFWIWQKRHKATDGFEIIAGDPGTRSAMPMAFLPQDTMLSLDTPLLPFKKIENGEERSYTSRDCFNIEKQFGYSYAPGSLELEPLEHEPEHYQKKLSRAATDPDTRVIKFCASNISKTRIRGSFIIEGYLPIPGGEDLYLGSACVLSRWNLEGCSNCQKHLNVAAYFDIPKIEGLDNPQPYIRIASRHGDIHHDPLNTTNQPTQQEEEQPKKSAPEGVNVQNMTHGIQLNLI